MVFKNSLIVQRKPRNQEICYSEETRSTFHLTKNFGWPGWITNECVDQTNDRQRNSTLSVPFAPNFISFWCLHALSLRHHVIFLYLQKRLLISRRKFAEFQTETDFRQMESFPARSLDLMFVALYNPNASVLSHFMAFTEIINLRKVIHSIWIRHFF